ncbi:unnamed protein product [Auanema sp. JU1783]|nr:unnamed protein product [Auanema sp. JU1783]
MNLRMYLRIPTFVDHFFFTALFNLVSFIIANISLFDNEWIKAYYMNLSFTMGVCCTFKTLPFLNVTLVFMFIIVTFSAGSTFMSISTWIFNLKKAPDVSVTKWSRICVLFNILTSLLTIFVLIYFGLSFAGSMFRKLMKGFFSLSTCYWLLIPIVILNSLSIFCIASKTSLLPR